MHFTFFKARLRAFSVCLRSVKVDDIYCLFIFSFVSYREVQHVLHFWFWLFPEAINFSFFLCSRSRYVSEAGKIFSVCTYMGIDLMVYIHWRSIKVVFSLPFKHSLLLFCNGFWREAVKFKPFLTDLKLCTWREIRTEENTT